jgi:hypothetical protein
VHQLETFASEANMTASRFLSCTALSLLLANLPAATNAWAEASAAAVCPPIGFADTINYADNPSFETVGENGNPSTCHSPCTAAQESAADEWTIHSDNFGHTVKTRLEPLSVLDPNQEPFGTDPKPQKRMLHITAHGTESGVYQRHFDTASGTKVMFQVWTYVKSGKVAIQPHGGAGGPVAWSTKTNQWEELRVCTDGTVPVDLFVILNQDAAGGEFWIDRAEIRLTP